MYLDTDVILALIKDSDWLQSEVDRKKLDDPKTSATAVIEAQLVFIYNRRELAMKVREKIGSEDIKLVSTSSEVVEKSSELLDGYDRLNVLDSVHLAHAKVLEEPIISTDTLYPEIENVESIDPRDLESSLD